MGRLSAGIYSGSRYLLDVLAQRAALCMTGSLRANWMNRDELGRLLGVRLARRAQQAVLVLTGSSWPHWWFLEAEGQAGPTGAASRSRLAQGRFQQLVIPGQTGSTGTTGAGGAAGPTGNIGPTGPDWRHAGNSVTYGNNWARLALLVSRAGTGAAQVAVSLIRALLLILALFLHQEILLGDAYVVSSK